MRPKLLLADESVTIRKVVELTFAEEGVDVTSAADAQSAMLKFVEIQPDIVLVDVGLKGTSGYEICEMIKKDDATRHLPVLLLVGSFVPFDQDEAERVGADGFLTKPFHSIRDLVDKVSELLGRPSPAEEIEPETALTEDIDQLYSSSFAETVKLDEMDTFDDMLGDAGLDDEMIETTYPSEPFADDIMAFEPTGERASEFDWSPQGIVADAEPIQEAQASFEPRFRFDETDAEPVETLPVPEERFPTELSPEIVALVTDRVIEKLSDRVVREIAQEVVPRIAEKLIREALAEEKK